jgi:hypothetical protein
MFTTILSSFHRLTQSVLKTALQDCSRSGFCITTNLPLHALLTRVVSMAKKMQSREKCRPTGFMPTGGLVNLELGPRRLHFSTRFYVILMVRSKAHCSCSFQLSFYTCCFFHLTFLHLTNFYQRFG